MSDYYDLGARRWRPLAKAAERRPVYPELSTLLGRGASEPGLGYEGLISALWGALAGAWLKIQELRGQVDDSHFDGELRMAEEPDIDLGGRLTTLETLVRIDGMRISSLEENRRDDLDRIEGSFGAISEELGKIQGRLDKFQENQWVDLRRLELLKERLEKLKAPAAAVEVEVTSDDRPKTSFSFSPGWPPVEHAPRGRGLDGERVSTEPACPICQGFGRLYRAGGGWLPLEPDTTLSGGRVERCPCRLARSTERESANGSFEVDLGGPPIDTGEIHRRGVTSGIADFLRHRAEKLRAGYGEGSTAVHELEMCADIIEKLE